MRLGATPLGGADPSALAPLVERAGRGDLEVIIDEILQGKIGIDREKSPGITEAARALGEED